jgi:hypothetical protein
VRGGRESEAAKAEGERHDSFLEEDGKGDIIAAPMTRDFATERKGRHVGLGAARPAKMVVRQQDSGFWRRVKAMASGGLGVIA